MDHEYQKYLKYKRKYLNLKHELEGGDPGAISTISSGFSAIGSAAAKGVSVVGNAAAAAGTVAVKGAAAAGTAAAKGAAAAGTAAAKGASAAGTAVAQGAAQSAAAIKNTADSALVTKQYDDAVMLYNSQPNATNWAKLELLKTKCEEAATKAGYTKGGNNNCSVLPVDRTSTSF